MGLGFFRRKGWVCALVVAVGLGAAGWLNRTALLSWYYLRGLAGAADGDRATWVERVAGLDEEAIPGLLAHLASADARICANCEAALSCLVRRWGAGDGRSVRVLEQLTGRFGALSGPGQEAGLELVLAALGPDRGKAAPPSLVEAAGPLLAVAAKAGESGVRLRALALADVLAERTGARWAAAYRTLVGGALSDRDAECRVRAVHLILHAALRKETALLGKVVPLLRDPAAQVRRAALLAVGMAEQTIREDDLLPLLHDPDAEVRRLCEGALRGRGLQEDHLRLARLISSRKAEDRLGVVLHLRDAEDLDPGVWLRRLSHDPDQAVRFAAMAAADRLRVDLGDRLRAMRNTDPSPTVRQWAGYYLQRRASPERTRQ
ncbi:MAG: hypothetical protein IT429_04010 [Gemmataceae bacterium]|nr:hypothetical protein [Gemmataceae bacterium]